MTYPKGRLRLKAKPLYRFGLGRSKPGHMRHLPTLRPPSEPFHVAPSRPTIGYPNDVDKPPRGG